MGFFAKLSNGKWASWLCLLAVFFFTIISSQPVMAMRIKRDVTQEEVAKYTAIVTAFVEKTKGWKPEEFTVSYITVLEDAPLAAFNAVRYDAIEEMRTWEGFGSHPTGELQVYVQTEEMRAFADYEEFRQIYAEAKAKGEKEGVTGRGREAGQ